MAKIKQTVNVGMVADGSIPSRFTFPGGFHIPTDHPSVPDAMASLAGGLGMSVKGLVYSIQYGLSQSGQDCVAGLGKKLDERRVTEGDVDGNKYGSSDIGEPYYNDAEKATIMHDTYKERFDAILAGEIGHRSQGPRVKGPEKVLREVAWEQIVAKASAVGKGALLPKKASDRDALVDKYLAKPELLAIAKAEADRRMGAVVPDVGDLLDDLVA